MKHGSFVFNYVAHYDAESNTWYKYNPFDDNFEPSEPIEGTVNAWISDLGVFLR